MTKKQICWAYKTSPNAERFGFVMTGCYIVQTVSSPKWMPRAIAGFATFDEAKTFAEGLGFEYSRYTLTEGYEKHAAAQLADANETGRECLAKLEGN